MSSKYDMIYDAMIYGECEPDPPEEFSSCPKCSGELIPRKGRYGLFYGCKNYPKCKFTCSKDEYNEKGETEQKHEAKWELGAEYEYAYCSHCGHQQWANWDSYRDAADNIGKFHKTYKFCPECGSEMKGDEVHVRR